MKSIFNYESKIFGLGDIKVLPWFIPALKIEYVLKSLKNLKGKLLEVGCGGGAMIKTMSHCLKNVDYYGLDFSEGAIKMAKDKPQGIKFRQGSIYKLPYKNECFDAVVGFDVFEHLNDLDRAFSESYRVLKTKGLLHVAIPLEGSFWNIEGLLTHLGWKAKEIYCGHVNNFGIGDLEKRAGKNGFKLINRVYSSHLIYQIVDVLFFSLIYIRGKNFPYQIEGFIDLHRGSFKGKLLYWLKSIFATLTYYESKILFWFPGLTGHFTYQKIT